MIKQNFLYIYEYKYKHLLVMSLIVLLICISFLGYKYFTTGEFISKGVSLKGGISLTIPVEQDYNTKNIENQLQKVFSKSEVNIRSIAEREKISSIIVESTDINEQELIIELNKIIPIKKDQYTIEFIGSALGKSFFKQIIRAVILAFIAMAIVVFITFRKIIPSLFVILAAFSDIISTLAVASFFDVKLNTAGIAAFLMLIGYSVDTDILLTTRVLKRKEGTIFERTIGALKTGMTMSLTAIIAVGIGYFFTDSDVIKSIMFILMIGLLFDILYTWIQNAGILRWYLEKHEEKM